MATDTATTQVSEAPQQAWGRWQREHAMKGKDRWHALFVLHDITTPALELLHEYRTR